VVSLVPSATESLRSWGIVPVACTRFCEQPDLPHVGGTKNPDIAAIVDLAPDVVVLDAQENRVEDHDALVAAGLPVHVLDVVSVDDALRQVSALAERLGATWRSDDPPPARSAGAGPVRVFVPIWRRPWMTINGNTYGSDLLARLGARNVFADHPDRYPRLDLEAASAAAPDLVLAPTEPYAFRPEHLDELRRGVAPVVVVDGRDLFWWGVRTPGALVRLAVLLSEHA
jgi:ABC-type Fe3+-hydroxamate transport system substrate-binding protein